MALTFIVPGREVTRTDEVYSPDYMANEFFEELKDRITSISEFRAYLENAPLGNVHDEVLSDQEFPGIAQLRDMSKNNYAKLIVSATTDRLGIDGFRTASADDEYGDTEAAKYFEQDDMGTGAQEAMSLACGYRTSYLYVDPITKRQRVIPPTNGAIAYDVSGEVVSAVVMFRDRVLKRDVMHLFMRDIDDNSGEATGKPALYVATREVEPSRVKLRSRFDTLKVTRKDSEIPLDGNIGSNWVWWKNVSVDIERIPVTGLKDKDGENEFESHSDVIDRLNHMIFQRVIIATMQSFRQRAVKGDFPEKDKNGEVIDYDEMFGTGPGALWMLPSNTEMWESTPPQFQDILSSVKDDTRDLASATYTPMSYFSDSANNSAEGAMLQRENYISKIADRRRRFGSRWKRHMSILFEVMGDKERSDETQIEPIWQPLQVESLNQRVQAFSTLVGSGVALKTAMRDALGFSPKQIKRAESEAMMQSFLQPALAPPSNTPLERRQFGAGGDNGGGTANGGGAAGGLKAAANRAEKGDS